ncbi:hypothetical protein QYE76_029379 [Lolium multiflorum]|uniref:Uncharacterized protein n=1 Tax=Lolium multiflorum TaxID=4521 RepID=A0AAD8VHU0_LOLMU|nr:hypothetical protein QYE76_029379 [Lolium multiflorum]
MKVATKPGTSKCCQMLIEHASKIAQKAQLRTLYSHTPDITNPQFTELTGTMVGEWSVGLFDCFGDFGTCCLTFWCPCVTFGRIAEIVDKGSTCRMGREQQDGWVCAKHESTRKARDVLLERWKGSNEMVVDMAAPEKQGMEAPLIHVIKYVCLPSQKSFSSSINCLLGIIHLRDC